MRPIESPAEYMRGIIGYSPRIPICRHLRSKLSTGPAFATGLFLFAIIASGQEPSPDCPAVTVLGPDHTYPWNVVRISAETLKSPVKGDWLVVKKNYRSKRVDIEKITDTESIEIIGWQTNDSGVITATVTVKPSPACRTERYGTTSVVLTENPGSPLIIDEFGKLTLNDERARLDVVADEMEKRPRHELLIFVNFRRTELGRAKVRRLQRMLAHLSDFRKLALNRITFLLHNSDTFSARFESRPQDEAQYLWTEDFLVIPAERFGEFKRLFGP